MEKKVEKPKPKKVIKYECALCGKKRPAEEMIRSNFGPRNRYCALASKECEAAYEKRKRDAEKAREAAEAAGQ